MVNNSEEVIQWQSRKDLHQSTLDMQKVYIIGKEFQSSASVAVSAPSFYSEKVHPIAKTGLLPFAYH